jgi:ABC-type sugar transport system ATPase subunit
MNMGEPNARELEGEVEMGIRPEDMEILPRGNTDLESTVELISNIGSEIYVHARLGEAAITVRAPKDVSLKHGDIISLKVSPQKIHCFQQGRGIRW